MRDTELAHEFIAFVNSEHEDTPIVHDKWNFEGSAWDSCAVGDFYRSEYERLPITCAELACELERSLYAAGLDLTFECLNNGIHNTYGELQELIGRDLDHSWTVEDRELAARLGVDC